MLKLQDYMDRKCNAAGCYEDVDSHAWIGLHTPSTLGESVYVGGACLEHAWILRTEAPSTTMPASEFTAEPIDAPRHTVTFAGDLTSDQINRILAIMDERS